MLIAYTYTYTAAAAPATNLGTHGRNVHRNELARYVALHECRLAHTAIANQH
jgi:hypothetical protein